MITGCYDSHPVSHRTQRAARLVILLLAIFWARTGAAWTVDVAKDPLTRQEHCMLHSETQTIPDGYGETPVSLVFNGEALLVVMESHIDTGFADLELLVDEQASIKTTKVAKQIIVIFDNDLAALIDQFKKGHETTVYLRFWPTWPATQRFPAKFSLKGFTKAYNDFEQSCRQGRQADQ